MEGYKECRYLVCILSIAHSLNIRYLTWPFSPYFHDSDSFILQLHRIIWQELHTILSKIIKKPQYAKITFKNGQLVERTLDRGSKKISEQWVWMSILNFFKHYKVRTVKKGPFLLEPSIEKKLVTSMSCMWLGRAGTYWPGVMTPPTKGVCLHTQM